MRFLLGVRHPLRVNEVERAKVNPALGEGADPSRLETVADGVGHDQVVMLNDPVPLTDGDGAAARTGDAL